jgi:hypothetical protein
MGKKRGLWDNIHAKRRRIAAGSGERMRKPGEKGAPTQQDFENSRTEEVNTPSTREIGRTSLTKIYTKDTPGQIIRRVVKENLNFKRKKYARKVKPNITLY